jgi:3'-phosphoadenosine 5'-phosphosulfate sulfotransferase (PAPS reductase)/FAD synthetase/DNA-binding XRE family transcriptional regulator
MKTKNTEDSVKTIRHHARKNGLTTEETARIAGRAPSTLRSIATGRIVTPSEKMLLPLSERFGTDIAVLQDQARITKAMRKRNPNLFGEWLKDKRIRQGVPVRAMAGTLDVAVSTYRNIESGRIVLPPENRLKKIAEVFATRFDSVLRLARKSAALAAAAMLSLHPADISILYGRESGGLPLHPSLPGFETPAENGAESETLPEHDTIAEAQRYRLELRRRYPLELKVEMSLRRIRDWYHHHCGNVFVSFSGGKDSSVLLDLVRSQFPDVPAIFAATPEFAETMRYVRTIPNLIILKPRMSFEQVLEKYGYPVVSKDQATAIERYRNTQDPKQREYRIHGFPNGPRGKIYDHNIRLVNAPFKISAACCRIMKTGPLDKYAKDTGRCPYVGTLADESSKRESSYLKHGCNAYGLATPQSRPLSFWTTEDIWEYIRLKRLPYNRIYDQGECRSGCKYCLFGAQFDGEPNRFQRMKQHHPEDWRHAMEDLGYREVLDHLGIPADESAQMCMNF